MNEALTIRLARAEDAEAIHAGLLALARTMGAEAKMQSTPDDIRRHGFGENPAFEVLVAEVDGQFAGMCLYLPVFSTWLGTPGVYIQDLFVDERYRSLRIGEALVRRVARIGRERGANHLRLAVDFDNDKAQRFYERIGVTHHAEDRIHSAYGAAFVRLSEEDPQ
jgi:ribosomal protein S18 acetylase RimI-like enzyme